MDFIMRLYVDLILIILGACYVIFWKSMEYGFIVRKRVLWPLIIPAVIYGLTWVFTALSCLRDPHPQFIWVTLIGTISIYFAKKSIDDLRRYNP